MLWEVDMYPSEGQPDLAARAVAADAADLQLADRLARPDAPTQELRNAVASNIRNRVNSHFSDGHWSSRINNALSQMNSDELRSLLDSLADLLSGQPTSNT